MYSLRPSSGLGAVDLFGQRCVPNIDDPSCPAPAWWMRLWNLSDTTVGVPPAPSGSILTVPPASGAEAQATVDALLNQQLEAQQAANAGGVQSSVLDQAASGIVDTGSAVGSFFSSPWFWGALGLGAFALLAMGADQPRRYGR